MAGRFLEEAYALRENYDDDEKSLEERKESEEKVTEEEELLEEGIHLNPDDFISKPFLSEKCTLHENVLVFDHSFGYDCKQYYNLVMLQENILVFYSGNLLHFFNTRTQELTFRRSASGGGIGHIATNPDPLYNHLAVAENGDMPLIIIYEWPTFKIVALLKEGTQKTYSSINYSPDGKMLCSQGGEPDYQLTVWKWKTSKIILRSQSYINDVYVAKFSPTVPGNITTSGAGHIKFWKMARTFTGLKLMGMPGRFGKTEMSDIIGFFDLPDGKILSGCEWGNILLWEEGLIQVEARRKNGKACHDAPITHFEFEYSGDLITAGMDGYVKLWYFDTIDNANPPEDYRYVELEPMIEIKIEDEINCTSIMTMLKIYKDANNQEYYCQDGNGGIWKYHIMPKRKFRRSRQLYICHGGPVMDLAASPINEHFATLGKDGRLFVYNYIRKEIILIKKFQSEGRCLIWLPFHVDKTGSILVAGFKDGIVRVVVLSLEETKKKHRSETELINIIQVIKAHDKPITAMSINEKGNLLVTGSEEARIFVFRIKHELSKKYVYLEPIGFVPVASNVTFLNWKPLENATLLVCCEKGEFTEMTLPELSQTYTEVSYNLEEVETKTTVFHSCKSKIERDIKIKEIEDHKMKKLEKKRQELEKIKKESPGIDIDEETFLTDSESEEELEPIYIPEEPNPILFGMYTPRNTIWISMAGYDAGFIYEYVMGKDEPIKCTPVKNAYDIAINTYLYSHTKKYLILGMQDGCVRINRVNPDNFADLSDYWLYSMHDNRNGRIRRICFNFNQHYIFTCGDDGNIFSYHVNFEDNEDYITFRKMPVTHYDIPTEERVEDIVDKKFLSLEGTKVKAEYDRKMALANLHKQHVLDQLAELKERFLKIMERNQEMAASQRIPMEMFEIHPDITQDLNKELQGQIDLVKRKLAFKVEKSTLALCKVEDYYLKVLETMSFYVIGIRNGMKVSSFRLRKLPEEFYTAKTDVKVKIIELERKGRGPELHVIREEAPREPEAKVPLMELFLRSIPTDSPEYKANKKLQRLIEKYRQRKLKEEHRQRKWKKLWQRKPDITKMHPSDIEAILNAEETVGDFKLKSAPDYRVPKHLRISTVNKYDELLNVRERMHMVKHEFNQELYSLRDKKITLVKQYEELKENLNAIHTEINENQRKFAPPTPQFDESLEFPEKDTVIKEEDFKEYEKIKKEEEKQKKATASDENRLNKSPGIYTSRMVKQSDEGLHIPEPKKSLTVKVNIVPPDPEYESLLGSYYMEGEKEPVKHLLFKPYFEKGIDVSARELNELATEDNTDTKLETELKALRLKRKLHEQDNLLEEIEKKTEEFDQELVNIKHMKVTAQLDSKLLELHSLTLEQEMLILKDYEAIEDEVSSRVMSSLEEKHNLELKMAEMHKQIDNKQQIINEILDKESDILRQFQQATAENKFADFLKKIFKKKYKAPKIRDPDASSSSSESESSSSTSEEDEDAASIESGELGIFRFDEDICPEGCDRALYDLTFTLRSQRHSFEQQVIEERKAIDVLKKELDSNTKKIKVATAVYGTNQEELEILQKEKQQRLNEVNCLVLLKLDQILSLKEDSDKLEAITKTLVFSKEALKQLHSRVGELDKEAEAQMDVHMENRKHLHRLKLDCQHMTERIRLLKEEISECMYRKFNGKINLDELEEAILRRLVAEMKNSLADVKKEYDKKITELQEQLDVKQQNFCRCIQENTEKLNLLLALEEEKNELEKILRIQKYRLEEATEEKPDLYKSDIQKLVKIKNNQVTQIESLKHEIKTLSLKSRPLPPIAKLSKTTIPREKPEDATIKSSEESLLHLSIEEEEEETELGIEVLDPTGIRGILNEIAGSIQIEQGEIMDVGSVKKILLDITEQLQTKEPSVQDITVVQQLLENILQQTDREGLISVAPPVKEIIFKIITDITQGFPEDDVTFIQNIACDIVDDVQKTAEGQTCEKIINDVVERIYSRRPLADEPQGTGEILQEIAKQLKSSDVLYDPILAAKQIVYDIIASLQPKEDIMEHNIKSVLISCVEKLTNELETCDYNEGVNEILEYIVQIIRSKLSSIEEDTKIENIMESILNEIHLGKSSLEDITRAKDVFKNVFLTTTNPVFEEVEETLPEDEASYTGGAKDRLQRLMDERGSQDEQLFYVPKCMYINSFYARMYHSSCIPSTFTT